MGHIRPFPHGSLSSTVLSPLGKHFVTLTSLFLRMLFGPATADFDFACVADAGVAEWKVLHNLAIFSMSPSGHCLRNSSFSLSTASVAPSNITAASA